MENNNSMVNKKSVLLSLFFLPLFILSSSNKLKDNNLSNSKVLSLKLHLSFVLNKLKDKRVPLTYSNKSNTINKCKDTIKKRHSSNNNKCNSLNRLYWNNRFTITINLNILTLLTTNTPNSNSIPNSLT